MTRDPASEVIEDTADIPTADGLADAVTVMPPGDEAYPGVIFYPDAFGPRPAIAHMAARLAGSGYVVLVVNPFYRLGRAPVLRPGFSLADPEHRARLMKMIDDLGHEPVTRDAQAFVAWLDAHPRVGKSTPMSAVGFCMGGAMAVRAAAAAPHRIGAAVSLHGGRLVTDEPHSPHRLIGRTRAAFHIGIAADDDEKESHAKDELAAALTLAGRPFTLQVYAGARHGWAVPDSAAHDPAQAEAAWAAMLSTLQSAKEAGAAR